MNTYSNNILKQFRVKKGRLHYHTGPLAGKPAGHKRANGNIFVQFNGFRIEHDALLFLYNEALEAVQLDSIDTSAPQKYRTITGHRVYFYSDNRSDICKAPPYVIHGAVEINHKWHACQWTDKGLALQSEYNLMGNLTSD